MKNLGIVTALGWLSICASGAALAADLPSRKGAPPPVLACSAWGESQVALLPTLEEMRKSLGSYYEQAVVETQRPSTINSSSNRYIWAVQASNACGTAIGYASSGEVNAMRFWNCECYFTRMKTEPAY